MIDQSDLARGARVEIAVRAAQDGDIATAAGILAGMSREERNEFGPLITGMFPVSTLGEPFGAASFLHRAGDARG